MLAIFLLMLDRLGLRLIPPHILGSELFVGLGLDRLRNSSPPGSFPSGPLMFVGRYASAPSHGLLLLIVQARAWWPNLLHFLHWFGRPEYKILCTTVSLGSAPSAIDGILMYPGSLEISLSSMVIIGPVGLLM